MSRGLQRNRLLGRLASVGATALLVAGTLSSTSVISVLGADDPLACGARPLDVEIIVDSSGSMQSNSNGGQTRLAWAKQAATGLVTDLNNNGGVGGSGKHMVGVSRYKGNVSDANPGLVVSALSAGNSATTVNNSINALTGAGNTPFEQGMAVGRDDMLAGDRTSVGGLEVKQVMIFLSDGRPWPAGAATEPNAADITNFKAAADSVYSIAIGAAGGTGSNELNLPLMQALAKGPSNFFHVVDSSNLPGIFDLIFEEIACVPAISIDKSADPGSLPDGGGEVEYEYKVTNTGATTLTDVTVDDDKCDDVEPSSVASLAAGASTTFTCTMTLTETTTNVAVATGHYGDKTVTDDDTETVPVEDIQPDVDIDKSAKPGSRPEPGGNFEFTVTITNLSAEEVTITEFNDTKSDACDDDFLGKTLAPADEAGDSLSCTYTLPYSAVGVYDNTASVTVEDDDGNDDSDEASESVEVTDVPPVISVVKVATPGSLPEPGGAFSYEVTVTNESDESVWLTELDDDKFGDLNDADASTCDADGSEEILPHTSYTCTFDGSVTGNAGLEHTNEVTATAEDDEGTEDTATAEATVELTDVAPTVEIVKTAEPGVLPEPGGTFTFTLDITNLSDEAVTITDLEDDYALSEECLDLIGTELAPNGEDGDSVSCSYEVEHTVPGSHENTAVVVVTDDDDTTGTDDDDETVFVVEVDPTITVIKTAVPTSLPEPGGPVTFTVQVINNSEETVWLTSLIDDEFGDLSMAVNDTSTCDTDGSESLEPMGGSYTCTFTGSVTGNAGFEHENIVIATVIDDDQSEASNFDNAIVELTDVPPSVIVDKTVDPEVVDAGETVTFTVEVLNDSDEAVTLTYLNDSIYGNLDDQGTCELPQPMAAHATYTCTFEATITETETDVVTARVVDNDGTTDEDDDEATVTVRQALLIDKSVVNATKDRGTEDGAVFATPGDTLTYTLAYTLTNGPLHNVVITDVLPDGLGAPTNISDGGTYVAATHTITWDLGTVDENGSVTYDVVVAAGADELEQPLENVATIDSDETEPDDDDADTQVVPPGGVEGETFRPTLPPTDTVGGDEGTGSSGIGFALAILFLAGVAAVTSVLTVTPARVARRRQNRR